MILYLGFMVYTHFLSPSQLKSWLHIWTQRPKPVVGGQVPGFCALKKCSS